MCVLKMKATSRQVLVIKVCKTYLWLSMLGHLCKLHHTGNKNDLGTICLKGICLHLVLYLYNTTFSVGSRYI